VKKKILIIENDPYYNAFIKAVLSSANYHVEVAEDVENAKRKAVEKPSLILLSVDVPGGFKLFEIFRNSPDFKNIPLIILSSIPIKEKPTNFLSKPFTDEELLERVQNIIGFTISEEEFLRIEEEMLNLTKEKADLERRLRDMEKELENEREKRKKLLEGLKKLIYEFENKEVKNR
jgi:DNA-binding response OmpR family regulator